MSLINDALKRAGQKPAAAPSVAETAAGLSPVDDRPNGFPVLTLLIVLIPLIVLGVWFLAKGLQMHGQKPQATPTSETVAHSRTPEIAAAVPAIAPAAPTNAIPPPAAPPIYKLQGLYWRPSKPSAVINGKTVYIGDRVETARVTAIDQESVTITIDGQPKVLLLP